MNTLQDENDKQKMFICTHTHVCLHVLTFTFSSFYTFSNVYIIFTNYAKRSDYYV